MGQIDFQDETEKISTKKPLIASATNTPTSRTLSAQAILRI